LKPPLDLRFAIADMKKQNREMRLPAVLDPFQSDPHSSRAIPA
jgi:hypothetical protein